MSPIGGVGINLAIQDAVAAANILVEPLAKGAISDERLREVQRLREFPTRLTQGFQVFAHKRFIRPALRNARSLSRLPFLFKLLQTFPILQRIPARLIGLGVRPEHVRTPDTKLQTARST
jgi:2-polyprenyl-6-methoxyphenol hydroxylase-like FAD-dependent oxidoreductase